MWQSLFNFREYLDPMGKARYALPVVLIVTASFCVSVLQSLWSSSLGQVWPSITLLVSTLLYAGFAVLGWLSKLVYDRYLLDRAYSQRISEKMIERIHEYAERYYLPLASAAFNLISSLQAILSESNPRRREHFLQMAFVSLVNFLQVQLKMTRAVGGVIVLKDFDSEEQVVALRARAMSTLPFDNFELAMMGESDCGRLSDFRKATKEGDLSDYFGRFSNWSEDHSKVETLIRLFQCHNLIMQRSLGMVYEPWYRSSPPKLNEKCRDLAKQAQEAMSSSP
jgi:hypothetical protein